MIEPCYQIRAWLEGTYTLRIMSGFFALYFRMAPYLLISMAIHITVVRLFKARKITFLKRNEFLSIISASLIGLISPLPTFAAIPIGLSLLPVGIPFSAVMAFIISSPLINPGIFFLTATQLGLAMAVARTVCAFSLGVIGGLLAKTLFNSGDILKISLLSTPLSENNRTLVQEIFRNARYIVKTFSIAILISAAVKALISPAAIAALVGGRSSAGTMAAVALGVPLYTCGGAAIPLVQTLVEMGMNKGAVLAFFIAGPATKLETLYAYKNNLGMKALVYFLMLTLICSFLAGSIFAAL